MNASHQPNRAVKPTGVLLDVDGTLIDSNDAHAHAWVDALHGANIAVEYSLVRQSIGMGGDKLLPKIAGIDAESSEGKDISKRRGEIFKANYLPKIRAFPAVKSLLQRMKQQGLQLGIASSSKTAELSSLLRIAEADEFIDAKTSSDDAENSKPDPDIVRAALAKLGQQPATTIFLGDTPYDVEAGSKAGVKVVALRCGGWSDSDLEGAVKIYDDPQDLLANFEHSPYVLPLETD